MSTISLLSFVLYFLECLISLMCKLYYAYLSVLCWRKGWKIDAIYKSRFFWPWLSIYCVINMAGLKPALATVHDYAPLMKDFPLNELLSATELDKVRIAVAGIFNHLRKIRSTKYPIQRVLKLVEAISRDLSSQILKASVIVLLWFIFNCILWTSFCSISGLKIEVVLPKRCLYWKSLV